MSKSSGPQAETLPTLPLAGGLTPSQVAGTTFGNVPLNLETRLEVWDSPNSAGVVIDAVRCAKLALDRGESGPVMAASAYFMKSPPEQWLDEDARDRLEAYIAGATAAWPPLDDECVGAATRPL